MYGQYGRKLPGERAGSGSVSSHGNGHRRPHPPYPTGLALASTMVLINNVAPLVTAGPDQTTTAGTPLFFNGSFSDPGILDTHTIHWDFGDGSTITGTLQPNHIYTAPGLYTVTLTITDNHGGVGQDTLLVTVEASGYFIYLPAVVRP